MYKMLILYYVYTGVFLNRMYEIHVVYSQDIFSKFCVYYIYSQTIAEEKSIAKILYIIDLLYIDYTNQHIIYYL
jgi:hypothetical protein